MSTDLSDTDLRILSYLEQTYWETGEYPTHEAISTRLGISSSTVQRSLAKEPCKNVLRDRGITPPEDLDLLSPEQILAVNMYMDVTDRRSMREKLKIIGVTQAQWNAWLRQPTMIKYLEKRGSILFQGVNGMAYAQLTKMVGDGSLDAIKFAWAVNGTYNEKREGDVDIIALLTRIMEVLARHVKPEVLITVAAELEALGPGAPKMLAAGNAAPPVEDAVIVDDRPDPWHLEM